MQSLPQVQLVDIDGTPISADDQGDAASWPASNDVDGWYWEPGSGQDDAPTAAERADFEAWLASAAVSEVPIDQEEAWDFPRRRQVSLAEISQLAAHGCV
jgi:hypothetical protein